MVFTYPYEMMNYEWKRFFPWVTKAFEEINKLFHLNGVEHEIAFTENGTYIAQRGKISVFPYSFDKLPTIKKRYEEISSCFEPYVPAYISNAIHYICVRFCEDKYVLNTFEDLKKIWLEGDKDFVVDFLYELIEDNVNNLEEREFGITDKVMEGIEKAV